MRVVSMTIALMVALTLTHPTTAVAGDLTEASSGHSSETADPNRSPYTVNWGFDIGLSAGLGLLGATPRFMLAEIIRLPCPDLDCDPSELNALDRDVIYNHDPNAVLASDIGFFGLMTIPYALAAIDTLATSPDDGWIGYAKDAVVLSQTMVVALVVTNTFNLMVQRARPLVYDDSGRRSDKTRLSPNQYVSFPSGHTMVSFAMAVAYSWTFTERHPDSWVVYPVWIGTLGMATMAGIGRVLAGEHFPTDVGVAAAVGVGIGLMIPWLHMESDEALGSGFAIVPIGVDSGAGVGITWTE